PRVLKTDERVQLTRDLDASRCGRGCESCTRPLALRVPPSGGLRGRRVWDPDPTDPNLARWLLYFRRQRWDL
ncbi:MAG: hypothetical protein ACP5QO_17045, partial [Clostridia bacterium]